MRKIIIAAICLSISFVLPSATTPKKSQNSTAFTSSIYIYNWCSYSVTSVRVEYLPTSSVTNYPSPSFPIIHNGPSGDYRITYYLSGSQTGCTRWEGGGGTCIVENYNGSDANVYVTTNNNSYSLYLHDVPADQVECS